MDLFWLNVLYRGHLFCTYYLVSLFTHSACQKKRENRALWSQFNWRKDIHLTFASGFWDSENNEIAHATYIVVWVESSYPYSSICHMYANEFYDQNMPTQNSFSRISILFEECIVHKNPRKIMREKIRMNRRETCILAMYYRFVPLRQPEIKKNHS